MPFADLQGLKIYYERAGSGEPLLFISGTGGDLRNKPNQFDGPLPRSFDLLSYDQRDEEGRFGLLGPVGQPRSEFFKPPDCVFIGKKGLWVAD